jgi:L-lysine 2,3-aminomutase
MIPGTSLLRQPPPWQTELAAAVTDPAELLNLLGLGAALLPAARAAARGFPLRVPRGFVARMAWNDPADPLLRQVLPLGAEDHVHPDYTRDPVGDLAAQTIPGVLHKYAGRVLLTATGACAVHCRYCFRRHFPYAEANAAADHWQGALAHIAGDSSIREVILSGGDPLVLSDRRLAEFTRALAGIHHVQRLRIHTRLPIVLPARVNDELLDWLADPRFQTVLVVHANHAQEIDATVADACARLLSCGVTLLNQSVLLRGVNDSADALVMLSEALFAEGVLPYYLHMLDRVQGAAHFAVDEDVALNLMRQLNARLPGYLVPRLVREVAGATAKVPMTSVLATPP